MLAEMVSFIMSTEVNAVCCAGFVLAPRTAPADREGVHRRGRRGIRPRRLDAGGRDPGQAWQFAVHLSAGVRSFRERPLADHLRSLCLDAW